MHSSEVLPADMQFGSDVSKKHVALTAPIRSQAAPPIPKSACRPDFMHRGRDHREQLWGDT